MRRLRAIHRRTWIVIAVVLVALYVIAPQPHIEWTEATEATEGQPGFYPSGFSAYEYKLWLASSVFAHPASRRFALYLVGPQWRIFDVDFAGGEWEGFGTSALWNSPNSR